MSIGLAVAANSHHILNLIGTPSNVGEVYNIGATSVRTGHGFERLVQVALGGGFSTFNVDFGQIAFCA